MKMNKFLALLLTTAMLICLAACGKTDTNQPDDGQTQNEISSDLIKLDDDMSLVAGNSTGGWFSIATALADKANIYFEGFPIVATTGGATGNPQTVSSGEAQIGMSYGVFLNMAQEGLPPYSEKMDNLRSIAGLETSAVYFICDAATGYKTISDLVNGNATVSLGSVDAGAASYCVQDLVLQEYGVESFSDLQSKGSMYIADASSLYDSYSDGHFNVMCTMKAVPDSSTIDLLNNRESTILSLDESTIESLVNKYGWTEVIIPAGTYNGQNEEIHTVGIKTVLMCRDDIPDEVSYYIAKTLYEQKDYFDTVQNSWTKFTAEDLASGVAIELHPGAAAYWKEVGLL